MANYNNYSDNNSNGPVEFKLVEKLGILERHKSGWSREINIVAWNGGKPKFDIRDWDPDHIRMSRGITLYEDEAIKLTKILAQRLQMDNEQQQIHYRAMQVQNEGRSGRNDGQAQYFDRRRQNDRPAHYDHQMQNEEKDQYFDQQIQNEDQDWCFDQQLENDEQELYSEQQMDNEEEELYADQQAPPDEDLMYYVDNQADTSGAQAYAS